MNSAEYEQFTATLLRMLEDDPAVVEALRAPRYAVSSQNREEHWPSRPWVKIDLSQALHCLRPQALKAVRKFLRQFLIPDQK